MSKNGCRYLHNIYATEHLKSATLEQSTQEFSNLCSLIINTDDAAEEFSNLCSLIINTDDAHDGKKYGSLKNKHTIIPLINSATRSWYVIIISWLSGMSSSFSTRSFAGLLESSLHSD